MARALSSADSGGCRNDPFPSEKSEGFFFSPLDFIRRSGTIGGDEFLCRKDIFHEEFCEEIHR